jgi:hypothetical protein
MGVIATPATKIGTERDLLIAKTRFETDTSGIRFSSKWVSGFEVHE